MNSIEEVDKINKTVTVQAGIVLQQLQNKMIEEEQLFPLDLGAKGSCDWWKHCPQMPADCKLCDMA